MSWHHLGHNCSHRAILQRSPSCLDLENIHRRGEGQEMGERVAERKRGSSSSSSEKLGSKGKHSILRSMIDPRSLNICVVFCFKPRTSYGKHLLNLKSLCLTLINH